MANGRELRTVRTPDGRFQIEANDDGKWAAMTGEDGSPVMVAADEVTYASRIEAASYGRSEIIRMDQEIQRAQAAGEISSEAAEERRLALSEQNTQIMENAERHGISAEEILEMEAQGAANNTGADATAASGGMVGPPEPNRGPGGMAGLAWAIEQDAQDAPLQIPRAQILEAKPDENLAQTAGRTVGNNYRYAYNAGATGVELLSKPVGAGVSAVSDFFGAMFASEESGEDVSQTPERVPVRVGSGDDEKTISMLTRTTPPEERRPGQARAKSEQAIRETGRLSGDSSPSERRRAAITYANGMLINGHNPDPRVLANLEAGDNMRGDLKAQAEMNLKYAQEEGKAQARALNSPSAKAVVKIFDNFGGTFPEHVLERIGLTEDHVTQMAYTTYGANMAVLRANKFPDEPAEMSYSQTFLYTTALREALSQHNSKDGGFAGFGATFRNTLGQLSDAFKTQETRMNEVLEELGAEVIPFIDGYTRADGTIDVRGLEAEILNYAREQDESRAKATEEANR